MTALAALLANPSQAIAFVVRFDERNPATDVVTTRSYQTANRFGTEGYPAFLSDPGGRSDKLEADELAAVAVQTVAPVRLLNEPSTPGGNGPLDFLLERTLAGRDITIIAGHPSEAIANYEPVVTGVMDREPIFDGGVVEIRIKSPLERLSVDLDVGTYVGEPGALSFLTATGRADAADSAAHHLTEFTVAGRFRHETVVGAAVIFRRLTSGTANNWQVFLVASTGELRANYSVGGVAAAMTLTSPDRYDDDEFHAYVFARRAGHAYLMVDGTVVAESLSPGTPDQPAVGVRFGNGFQPGEILDHRIFNHYIAADEMRSAMAVRANGGEDGLVGLWRGDDQTGSTLTDYSSIGAHATIAGTEGVDFEHVSSDLGTAELAGRSMPALIGEVFHAPTDLVDPQRERHRANDRASAAWLTGTVRDEGEELADTIDYDWPQGDPTVALVAEAGEPLTVGVDFFPGESGIDRFLGSAPQSPAFGSLLVDRGPLDTADLAVHRLHSLFPHDLGLHTRRQRIDAALREVLGGMGAFAYQRIDGRIGFDALVPPTAPGPRGGKCVEIASAPGVPANIAWATGNVVARKNFSLMGWYKLHRSWDADAPFGDTPLMVLNQGGAFGFNNEIRWNLDSDGGSSVMQLELYTNGSKRHEVGASFLVDDPLGNWVFLAVANNYADNIAQFFVGTLGGTIKRIGTTTGLDFDSHVFPDPEFDSVMIGGEAVDGDYHFFRGGVAEPRIYDTAVNHLGTFAELQAVMNSSASTANDTFLALLDGTSAAALTDVESSAVGTVTGDVEERPDLEIDLASIPMTFRPRKLRPAKRIEISYRRNYAALTTEQIAATVPADERMDLQQEANALPYPDLATAADYLDSREIAYASHWATKVGAAATLRLAKYRHAPGREAADLVPLGSGTPSAFERLSMLLGLGAEIKVSHLRWANGGVVYRLIANSARLGELRSTLELFR